MNEDRLLAHYERIADAPDAIARLRRFILDLAVRGKLVLQEAKDEPASELLKRIVAKNARLVNADKIKKATALPSAINDEAAFPTPTGWTRTTLGAVSNIVMGQSPPGDTYNTTGEGVPLINGPVEFSVGSFGKTVVNQYTTAPTNFCEKDDLLICVRGSTTGRTNIAGFRACIGRGVAAIQPYFEDAFIRLFIWSVRGSIIGMGRGIAFPSVSRKQIEDLEIPLPPLAEQHRIVAKVDELMALCDRLETARAEREAKRDRLAAASLARLNEPDPETFQNDARFALDALQALTTRPDQIKQLRQTVLNLAVRGKVVPQEPKDEPALELLKRIEAEKALLVKAGKAKESKEGQAEVGSNEPFDIPRSWHWTTLGKLAHSLRYGTSAKCSYENVGVPVLRIPNVENGRINIEDLKFGPLPDREAKELRLHLGDILMVRSNGSLNLVGRPALVESHAVGFCYAGYLVRVRSSAVHLDARYLVLVLNSAHVRDQIELPIRTTVGLKNVNATELSGLTIPLPPLAEQHRIVAKVDALMALCDRLEASLTAASATRRRLLDALLAEALAPADARAMEAAE
jgi:type I restriction enzyme S subunit